MESLRARINENDNNIQMDSIYHQLEALITFHSLTLIGNFSLSLEETKSLLNENTTCEGRKFDDQLSARNHRRMLQYCRLYQKLLEDSRKPGASTNLDSRKHNFKSVFEMPMTFTIMFCEGRQVIVTDDSGGYFPPWALYSMSFLEGNADIKKGVDLLVQTIQDTPKDPYLNAAMIHNVFAKGYPSENKIGLMMSRLYMNFALMLEGHIPAIIDSQNQTEYFELVQPNKLDDPEAMAFFLMKNLQNTYENYFLPMLCIEAKVQGMRQKLD